VTFSPEIRSSFLNFSIFLLSAVLLLGGLRPATIWLLGRPMLWHSGFTVFWAALLAVAASIAVQFSSPWTVYCVAVGAGFFVGMVYGSLNPNNVKNEDLWMMAGLGVGIGGTVLAALIDRHVFDSDDSLVASLVRGAIAGGVLAIVMAVLLMRLSDRAHGFARMAVLYLHNDNFAPKAVSYLDNALALRPDDPELYNLRGVAWSKMDEPVRAAADWAKAAELSPKDPEPHMNLGVDHMRREEFDQAIAAFQRAIAINPRHATAHSNIGTAFERKGELERAIAHYGKAIEVRRDYANAHSNRAYAYFKQGEHEKAIADCDRALEIDPGFGNAMLNRGHALAALGRHEEAWRSFQDAIDTELNPEAHEEALKGLEALEHKMEPERQ
jgi:tetratricopeptide (TPR) repeat protein